MKTKNLFLVMSLLAIAGLWTSCSNDKEVIEGASNGKQAIEFRMQGGTPELRATGTTIDYVNAFVVNAQGNNSGVLMNGITVYRLEGIANVFEYNPKAYYGTTDTDAMFSAYSPVSPNITTGLGITLPGVPDNTIAYTVNQPDATGITAQEDFLVAYTRKTAVNVLPATPVAILFKHALSRVYVTATSSLTSDVIINSLELDQLYGAGTLKIDADTWGIAGNADINKPFVSPVTVPGNYKILWTPTGTQTETYAYVLPTSGVAVPSGADRLSVVSTEQGMLILPQTTDPGTFRVRIAYTIGGNPQTESFEFSDLNFVDAATTPDLENEGLTFEFGRQYALNISFVGTGEISFTVSVEDWSPILPVPAP